ncbi:hypothetical protein N1851_018704 [Merluccius polli]|uniref:Uncharacterized protein n=1 Tax=Merluccius polli TaxID=89951 RepID=A0AA47NY49_MERPO|nr:hypothetical protein N1851_018704 [Merluccius polli]
MKSKSVVLLLILITFLLDLVRYAVGHNLNIHEGRATRITYTRDFLLNLRSSPTRPHVNDTSLLPPDCVKSENSKARKRGRKGGIRERIKRQPYRQPLPSVMLGNVQSLRNKVDELRACSQYLSDYRQSCLICLTESWLTEADPDSSIDLEGFTLVRMDRNQNSGKKRGGADTQAAATLLHELVSQAETEAPDAANFIMGDFNLCSLKEHLPTYQQYVTCSTRDNACLDLCYGNIQDAFYSKALPGLGNSDHNMIKLTPAYVPRLRREKVKKLEVKCWTATATDALQDCFASMDWDVVTNGTDNVNDAAFAIAGYIQFCEDLTIPKKTIKMFPNNKPWVTPELKHLLNQKKCLFKSGVAKQRGHSVFIASTSFLGVLFNLHPPANQNRVFTQTTV